jgi:anti-anti-sigma factor
VPVDDNWHVRTTESDGELVVELRGDVDLDTVALVRDTLDRACATGRSFWVDVAGVTFIDSSVLQALLRALRSQRAAGLDMTFLRPSPAVMRVLEMMGLRAMVAIADPPPSGA